MIGESVGSLLKSTNSPPPGGPADIRNLEHYCYHLSEVVHLSATQPDEVLLSASPVKGHSWFYCAWDQGFGFGWPCHPFPQLSTALQERRGTMGRKNSIDGFVHFSNRLF